MRTSFAIGCAALLALAGCASAPKQMPPPPADALDRLDLYLQQTLRDPSSAQQYSVAPEPFPCFYLRWDWCLCYRLNAKNGFGAYTGVKYGMVDFHPETGEISDASARGLRMCRGKDYVDRDASPIHLPK